jgi:3-oxoacyl-[acyl-carrier protein] reductase/meso-butanediol dehydrogenase/(S,S)-butanediol dehydrogenase/diacetyl reductase
MDDIDAIERGAAWQAMIRERIPLGRAGRGEDIAWITVFLCSDQGAWITGQSWNVDGGTVTAH